MTPARRLVSFPPLLRPGGDLQRGNGSRPTFTIAHICTGRRPFAPVFCFYLLILTGNWQQTCDRPQTKRPSPRFTNGRLPVDMCPQFINHFPALSLVSQPGRSGQVTAVNSFVSSQHCCNFAKTRRRSCHRRIISEEVSWKSLFYSAVKWSVLSWTAAKRRRGGW